MEHYSQGQSDKELGAMRMKRRHQETKEGVRSAKLNLKVRAGARKRQDLQDRWLARHVEPRSTPRIACISIIIIMHVPARQFGAGKVT